MPKSITDDRTLEHYISIDITTVMGQIRVFLEENIKASVLEIVYWAGNPSFYKRQFTAGGFWSSWTTTTLDIQEAQGKKSWTTKLFSNPKLMTYDPDSYIHGSSGRSESNISGWEVSTTRTEVDRRENLDEYIAEGTNYDFPTQDWIGGQNEGSIAEYDFWWLQPRDYWTPMIEWWVTAGGIGAEFAQLMMDMGVTFDFNL